MKNSDKDAKVYKVTIGYALGSGDMPNWKAVNVNAPDAPSAIAKVPLKGSREYIAEVTLIATVDVP